MNTWFTRLKVLWAIVSGVVVPLILTVGPVVYGGKSFIGTAIFFVVAAGLPFINQISVITRLCLVMAGIGTSLIYDDPYRWPEGLLLTLGVPLTMYFVLRGTVRLVCRLGASIRGLRVK